MIGGRFWQRFGGTGPSGRSCGGECGSGRRWRWPARGGTWSGSRSLAKLAAALYSDEFLATLPNADPVDYFLQPTHSAGRDEVTRASLGDLETYLAGDLLVKVDLASMANGLECRSPFLDYRVVELAAALPVSQKLDWRRAKLILRRAFADLMPPDRPKRGFAVPLDHWLRGRCGPRPATCCSTERPLERGYSRRPAIERLLQQHDERHFDHSHRIWALLVLEWWHREWIDRRG